MIDTKCDIRHYSAFVAGSSVPRKGSLEPGAPRCHRDKPSLPLWRCRGEVAQRRSLGRRPFPGGFLAIKSQTPAEVLTPSKYTFPRPRPATAAQAPDPAASSRAGPGPRLPSEWRRRGSPSFSCLAQFTNPPALAFGVWAAERPGALARPGLRPWTVSSSRQCPLPPQLQARTRARGPAGPAWAWNSRPAHAHARGAAQSPAVRGPLSRPLGAGRSVEARRFRASPEVSERVSRPAGPPRPPHRPSGLFSTAAEWSQGQWPYTLGARTQAGTSGPEFGDQKGQLGAGRPLCVTPDPGGRAGAGE